MIQEQRLATQFRIGLAFLGGRIDAVHAAGALAAYEHGITVAEAKGDIQAAKEMRVFARRLSKAPGGAG